MPNELTDLEITRLYLNQLNKIKKGAESMEKISMESIQKYDRNLKNVHSVAKSERPSMETANEFLTAYSTDLRKRFPEITVEKAFATAMKDCPTLAALAIGHPFEMAVGHY